jgi:hypothetical protein
MATKKTAPTKLDLGSGSKKKEGFHGVDQYKMDGVDTVLKIGTAKWPFADNSIEEAYSSHFLEHLTAQERVHFYNELYRVLKAGAKATIITPHWASNRAYGDPTHQWPPVAEMSFYYLKKEWRESSGIRTDTSATLRLCTATASVLSLAHVIKSTFNLHWQITRKLLPICTAP